MTHGRVSTYVYHRCRCEDCRRANAQYTRNYRVRKAHGMKIRPWKARTRA